jgi:signal peptidase II
MLSKVFKSGLIWLWVTFLVLLLDRVSKTWVVQHLNWHEPLPVLPFFNLTLAFNTGAAFSFLGAASGWQNILFSLLAVVVSLLILGWLWQLSSRERWVGFALALILGGALGNAWDRVLYAHVIDFLDFHWSGHHFATFNIADSAICIGAVMLMIFWARKK